jgi:threonine synthase
LAVSAARTAGRWKASDAESFEALRNLARTEGLAVEPASAVAFAGYEKLVKERIILPDELVVINCTGHTTSVEKQVLEDGWSVDVELDEHPENLQEGLHAALEGLDERAMSWPRR